MRHVLGLSLLLSLVPTLQGGCRCRCCIFFGCGCCCLLLVGVLKGGGEYGVGRAGRQLGVLMPCW